MSMKKRDVVEDLIKKLNTEFGIRLFKKETNSTKKYCKITGVNGFEFCSGNYEDCIDSLTKLYEKNKASITHFSMMTRKQYEEHIAKENKKLGISTPVVETKTDITPTNLSLI